MDLPASAINPNQQTDAGTYGKRMFFWTSVVIALLILFAGVVALIVMQRQAPPAGKPAASVSPVAQTSPAKTLATTTDASDGFVAEKPFNVSRIQSAEALLVGGQALAEKDLAGLSLSELRVLRNTVYARHGRLFESPELQRHFSQRSWYKVNENYGEDTLSETDRENLKLIGVNESRAKSALAIGVEASSRLSEDFAPENTRDDRVETAWVEGVAGRGVGEWIAFTFKPQRIQYIEIFPGYGKSRELFYANHRLKRATLIFSDGTRAVAEFFDEMRTQTVALSIPVQTGSLRLIIEEVYPGEKYDDTVIAEISWR
jgi:hypothetical protein